MQSIELITALAGFISAFLIILVSMNLILIEMDSATQQIFLNAKAQKCALIVNAVYSQTPTEINEKIECTVINGKSISSDNNYSMTSIVLNKNTKTIVKNGKTIILVKGNEHYK